MKIFGNVMWAMLATFVLVGCSGCDEPVNVGDEVDCMQYRGQSYADVMDLEPRCGSMAWSWEQTIVNERGETHADLMEEAERSRGSKTVVVEPERTFAIAFKEFKDAERERTQCLKPRSFSFTSQECGTIDDLLGDLRDLEKEFPGRTKEIAPVVAWLMGEKGSNLHEEAAEFERQLKEEQFVLTTNYGRLEAEGKLPAKTHVPRCRLGIGDFEKYAELLLAMKTLGMEAAPNRMRLVYQQIGWQYEWPIGCEGDPKPNYEAAYKEYVAAGSIEDAQRAAGKQWRELVDEVCRESFYEDFNTGSVWEEEPGCNPAGLDDPETQQWLKSARLSETAQREAIVAEAREAEQFGLPCEALDIASRAGDLERVRLLQQEHPHCVVNSVAPGGKK